MKRVGVGASGLVRLVSIVAGPVLGVGAYVLLGRLAPELEEAARRVGGALVWMGVWWLTEALPLSATSLLPIALFPLLGVMTTKEAAAPFADKVIFLFMGGFMLALAMERANLHRRIALLTVLLVGVRPARLVLGFMVATATLSMWMSNTATAVMMFPIVLGVIRLVKDRAEEAGEDGGGGTAGERHGNFALCLLLGVAYAASIGGVATPIGTPPNAFLIAFLRSRYGIEISFGRWMLVGLPMVVIFIPVAWLTLTRWVYPIRLHEIPGGRAVILDEYGKMGKVSRAQWTIMGIFACAVAGWTLRDPLALLAPSLKPLLRDSIDDTVIALCAGLALFVIPTNLSRREFPLDWATAERMPWGVLLLFGGGLSLAGGVRASGLDLFIGGQFSVFSGYWPVVIVLLVSLTLIFLTEVTSNTATATIFFPILAGAAPALGVDPLLLLVPAALGVSCAFMLPMATPPNALVFATGHVTIREMARAGLYLNMLSAVIVTLLAFSAGVWFLGVNPARIPAPGAAPSSTISE